MTNQTITLEMIAHSIEGLGQKIASVEQQLSSVEQQLSETRQALESRMTRVERQMATKLDVSELRQDLVSFRHENRKAHVDLYGVLRQEIYERIPSP